MTQDEAAYAAHKQWQDNQTFTSFSDPGPGPDEAFGAGFDAGAEYIRQRVLKLWDDNGAWIPGPVYRELAALLHVPPERTLTERFGGKSKPSAARPPTY